MALPQLGGTQRAHIRPKPPCRPSHNAHAGQAFKPATLVDAIAGSGECGAALSRPTVVIFPGPEVRLLRGLRLLALLGCFVSFSCWPCWVQTSRPPQQVAVGASPAGPVGSLRGLYLLALLGRCGSFSCWPCWVATAPTDSILAAPVTQPYTLLLLQVPWLGSLPNFMPNHGINVEDTALLDLSNPDQVGRGNNKNTHTRTHAHAHTHANTHTRTHAHTRT